MSTSLVCRERVTDGTLCYTQLERNQSGRWLCPNEDNHLTRSSSQDQGPSGGGSRSNTNRGKGEDRNQSFGRESHTMQPKGGGNQRSRYRG